MLPTRPLGPVSRVAHHEEERTVTTLALAAAPPRARVNSVVYQLALAVVGSFLLAGLAQISIHLPFTPVPITGQTLGILLIGASLGPVFGAISVVLYLSYAVMGMHVLAPSADGSYVTGWGALGFAQFTGGYLWGFLIASALVGWLARRGWDRSGNSAIGAMLLGSIVIYLVGVPWLLAAMREVGPASVEDALQLGLYPFVIGDTLKLLLAAGLLPLAWKLVRRGDDAA
jgi:biotin transport system substrate-specific component